MTHRSRAAYRTLLGILPKEFTRKNGDELEAAFAERLLGSRSGPFGSWKVWIAAVTDLVRAAPQIWIRALAMGRRHSRRRTEGIGVLETITHDVRLALRSLGRSPGPTAVVLVTLILGIGANTAVFSMINGIILRPLEYPDPEQLFLVDAIWLARSDDPVTHVGGNFQLMEREASGFQSMVAVANVRQNLLGDHGAEQIVVGWASLGLFDVTGVTPVLGRGFLESDPPSTILLSHGLWQSYFTGAESVVGRSVNLDSRPVTIVGVLPPGFKLHMPPSYEWPSRIDIWKLPDPQWSNGDMWNRTELNAAMFHVIGRARPGVAQEQLVVELETIAAELRTTYSAHAAADFQLTARPLREATVGEVSPILLSLMGAVLLVLLIAGANVANLLLVCSETRRRELAVRLALGGSRARIALMLMTESAVLATLGTIGGVALAFVALDALIAMSPTNLPRVDSVAIDKSVLLFAVAVSVTCTVVVGLLPAFRGSRANPNLALQVGVRGATRHGTTSGRLLVSFEVALSFALLTGAGLLLRSFSALGDIRPGFDHNQLLTFSASVPSTQYQAPAETHRFFDELVRSAESVPGVSSAAVVWPLPLEGQTWTGSYATNEVADDVATSANYRVISAGYFATLNTRLLDGRTFREQDRRHVAIVSRALAEEAWPGEQVVGKRIGAAPWSSREWFDVIGVAEDIRYADVRKEAEPTIYFSTQGWSWADWEFGIVARTQTNPMSVVPVIKERLAELDPNVPLARPRAMEGYVADLLSPNTFALKLFTSFAVLAVVMAAVGIYGVLSHTVSQRTKEIGIRMALGARRRAVVKLVVGQGLRLTALGVAVGVVAAMWLSQFVTSLLYDVTPTDPITYGVIAAVVVVIGTLASYLPARRAASFDPVEALRE